MLIGCLLVPNTRSNSDVDFVIDILSIFLFCGYNCYLSVYILSLVEKSESLHYIGTTGVHTEMSDKFHHPAQNRPKHLYC